jgi:hypothetical protein
MLSPKPIAQIIRLRVSFPDNRIQSIRMGNAGEFRSKAFDDYCLDMGIKVEHSSTSCPYTKWSS